MTTNTKEHMVDDATKAKSAFQISMFFLKIFASAVCLTNAILLYRSRRTD
jgi:uncharacterized Tic20 family protein